MQETNTGKTGPPRLKTVGKSLLTPHPVLELDVHLGSPMVGLFFPHVGNPIDDDESEDRSPAGHISVDGA